MKPPKILTEKINVNNETEQKCNIIERNATLMSCTIYNVQFTICDRLRHVQFTMYNLQFVKTATNYTRSALKGRLRNCVEQEFHEYNYWCPVKIYT